MIAGGQSLVVVDTGKPGHLLQCAALVVCGVGKSRVDVVSHEIEIVPVGQEFLCLRLNGIALVIVARYQAERGIGVLVDIGIESIVDLGDQFR